MEIALLDAAVLNGQCQAQHGAHAVDDRPFALILRPAQVEDRADIPGHRDPVHRELSPGIHAHLGHMGEMTGMAEVEQPVPGPGPVPAVCPSRPARPPA